MAKATGNSKKKNPHKKPTNKRGATHVPLRDLAAAAPRAAERDALELHGREYDSVAHTVTAATRSVKSSVKATAKSATVKAPPVKVLMHDAKHLASAVQRTGKKLVEGGLDRKIVEQLPKRISLVGAAQRAWEKQREHSTPGALRRAREEAAELKTDMLAAGRFLLRHDAAAQKELDAIADGEGLADLVDDLRKLSAFYTRRASSLRDADVPENAPGKALEFATLLAVGVAAERKDPKTRTAYERRNKALSKLQEAMTEVRAAGEYVFRSVPAQLALFRQELRQARTSGKK